MVSLKPHLASLLKSLPPSPVDQKKLDELVKNTIVQSKNDFSVENRKLQWEYLLKDDIFKLATLEGVEIKRDADKYYTDLCGKLDLTLTFTEQDACEPTFPFTVLQDLLETQTITSCSRIFSWIETRSARLTKDMVPQKGKALILLRTLNDLLRRLSKMGTTTIFCGRILTFLSGVFPLGERSGVNLRGEYGPTWEGVRFLDKTRHEDSEKGGSKGSEGKSETEDDKMQVDEKKPQTPEEKKEEFYNTFWSLQLPFSKPPLFANKDTFPDFKEALNKVMPIIKEATAKERAMMGSRSTAPGVLTTLKRKRETSEEESNSNEYFFAKFLTSPDLLDLEIADTHFRRQFLFQLLILLNHLLCFTATAKAVWTSPRNRSLQMEFTLEETDAQWVQESLAKVFEELRQTTPNGRVFADTVHAILERERNWVKWKNELCTPFDKEPWVENANGQRAGLFDVTRSIRADVRLPPQEWKWKLGTEALSDIWDMGFRDLHDLRGPPGPGDVKDFVKKIKLEDARISARKTNLEKNAFTRMGQTAAKSLTSHLPQVPSTTGKSDTSTNPLETNAGSLAAARPVTSLGNSLLHPSLPPKPTSPSKLASSSQEPVKVDTAPAATSGGAASSPVTAPAFTAAPVPVPVAPPVALPIDPEIVKYEDNKQRWAWLALRAARDQYLQHFGKIGTGDIEALAQEIEKGNLKCEDNTNGLATEEHVTGSPPMGTENSSVSIPKEVEMDT